MVKPVLPEGGWLEQHGQGLSSPCSASCSGLLRLFQLFVGEKKRKNQTSKNGLAGQWEMGWVVVLWPAKRGTANCRETSFKGTLLVQK